MSDERWEYWVVKLGPTGQGSSQTEITEMLDYQGSIGFELVSVVNVRIPIPMTTAQKEISQIHFYFKRSKPAKRKAVKRAK